MKIADRQSWGGSHPSGAISKWAKSKAGDTVHPTSVHCPSEAADCHCPGAIRSWGLLTGGNPRAEDATNHRLALGVGRELKRRTGVEVPDLGRVDSMPMRTVTGLEKIIDRGACASSAAVFVTPCFTVIAALGVRHEPKLVDDLVRVHGGDSRTPEPRTERRVLTSAIRAHRPQDDCFE